MNENLDDFIPVLDLDYTDSNFDDNNVSIKEEEPKETKEVVVEIQEDEFPEVIVNEKKEIEENNNQKQNEDTSNEITDVALSATLDVWKQQGLLSKDTEISNWEEAQSYISNIPNMVQDNIVNSAPPLTQKLLQFAFMEGEEINKDSLKEFISAHLEDIETSNIDITTDDSARAYLKEKYKADGIKESVVDVMLDTLEDEGDIIEEAKKIKEKQTSSSKAQGILTQKEQQLQERQRAQEEYVNNVNKELEQTKWKESRVNKVKSLLATNKYRELIQNISKDPKALIKLADVLTYYNEEDKTFDFTNYVNQVETEKTNFLKDKINKNFYQSGNKGTHKKTGRPVKNLLESFRRV